MDDSIVYSIVQLGIIGGGAALLIIGLCIAGPFMARYWYKARKAELDSSLKQAMIERGMTAQQICAVIEASDERTPERPAPPASANEWKEWANDWKDWANRWKNRRARV
jgi:hypothetical protein